MTYPTLFDMLSDFNRDALMRITPTKPSFATDIETVDNAYVLTAHLPGVDKDDIEIDYNDDVLTISVSHTESSDEQDKNYVLHESSSYASKRAFRLENVDANGIKASLENGLLTVTLPTKELPAPTNRIEIA